MSERICRCGCPKHEGECKVCGACEVFMPAPPNEQDAYYKMERDKNEKNRLREQESRRMVCVNCKSDLNEFDCVKGPIGWRCIKCHEKLRDDTIRIIIPEDIVFEDHSKELRIGDELELILAGQAIFLKRTEDKTLTITSFRSKL
jgi:hypothetical protein